MTTISCLPCLTPNAGCAELLVAMISSSFLARPGASGPSTRCTELRVSKLTRWFDALALPAARPALLPPHVSELRVAMTTRSFRRPCNSGLEVRAQARKATQLRVAAITRSSLQRPFRPLFGLFSPTCNQDSYQISANREKAAPLSQLQGNASRCAPSPCTNSSPGQT